MLQHSAELQQTKLAPQFREGKEISQCYRNRWPLQSPPLLKKACTTEGLHKKPIPFLLG
uniref:Uncharacterized protein n=1 Tax=Triticum urartu TaxID=4572 RepID=A0A8R7QRK6_TRIUA